MRNLLTRGLFLLAALFALSACALTEDIVEVNYVSETSPQSLGVDDKQVRLSVDDLRGEYYGTIGAKVNGYGTELGAIIPTVPVRDIVYQAIEQELKARGIVLSENSGSVVTIEITALHNNFQVGGFTGSARGITAMNVSVANSSGTTLYDRNIAKLHVVEDIMLATGVNAVPAVEGALSKAVKSLFEDQDFVDALVAA